MLLLMFFPFATSRHPFGARGTKGAGTNGHKGTEFLTMAIAIHCASPLLCSREICHHTHCRMVARVLSWHLLIYVSE